jgi:hypothetical protein
MTRHWIAVASAEHVRRGHAGGFMQVCHGKLAPLRRVAAGDWVAYYSPTATFRGTDRLQAFTAIGVVKPGELSQADMGGGFCPFRREVDWLPARPTPIQPLLSRLTFAAGKRNWGYALRSGLVEIGDTDMATIAAAMGVAALASPARAA